MKIRNKRTIDNFNPLVLKNMILFSIRSKRAYSFQKDFLSYEKDQSVYEFIANFFLAELKKVIMTKPAKVYNEINEDLYYIKGKINSKRTKLIFNNKLNCTFSELSLNNKLNQIAKYILYYMMKDEELSKNKNIKKRILNAYYYFDEVELVEIKISDVINISLNRENKNYESLLLISKYILGCIKYNDLTKQKYIDIDSELWWIFQEFIRNYYDYYKNNLGIKSVSPSKYQWELIPLFNSNLEYLPGMRTDIEVDTCDQHIIIDAKCYENSLIEFYGKKMFHAGNLYQIKSYLDVYFNKETEKKLRGILIYPYNSESKLNAGNQIFYDEKRKYTIEIKTINFLEDWNSVCDSLNKVLDFDSTYNYILKTFE